jgi:mono/diheme cytochrome c family protein
VTVRLCFALATIVLATTSAAFAQSSASFSATPFRFTQQDGEGIYRSVCAGCHMPDGRGATGAGTYPSLIRNAKLEAAGYPVLLVVNGRKAMPSFGSAMTDAQIAAVVNYVRGNFGNAYADKVSADDVKAARQ